MGADLRGGEDNPRFGGGSGESIRVRTYRSAEELILELLNKTPGA